jgi:hypothetical protein
MTTMVNISNILYIPSLETMRSTSQVKYFYLIIFAVFVNCDDNINTDNICLIDIPSDTYNYPMTPENSEWQNYNPSEIFDINQLPDDIIENISTQGLLETCLTFPYYGDIGLTEYHQNAFDIIINNFNGFREFLDRPDASTVIFDRYQKMSGFCNHNNYPDFLGRGKSIGMSYIAIEMMLAQYIFLNHLNSDQLKEIANEAISTYNRKIQNEATNSIFNTKFTLVICGRILKIENYQPFVAELNSSNTLQRFLDQVYIENFEPLDKVLAYTMDYVKI